MASILYPRDNVLFRASLIITVSYSQIASVTRFQSISFPLPPKSMKKENRLFTLLKMFSTIYVYLRLCLHLQDITPLMKHLT